MSSVHPERLRAVRAATISSGLATGETVVLEGHLRLAPGSKVEVKNRQSDPSRDRQGAVGRTAP